MALQLVGYTSNVGTANYSVSLSGTLTGGIASSPSAGDLVVVVSSFGNTAAVAPTITGNNSGTYTYFNTAIHVNDTYDTEFVAGYKIQGGTVDTSLSITRTSNGAYGGATVVMVFRGHDATTPIYGNTAYTTKTNGAYPNPTDISVVTAGDIVLAMGAGTQPSTGSAFTVPAELTSFNQSVKSDGTTSDIGVWMAGLISTAAGSQSISSPSGGTSTTSCSGAAHSIGIAQAIVNDYPLTCNSGSYTYTGSSLTVIRNRVLISNSGTYSYIGSSADLTVGAGLNHRALTADPGSYVYTGSTATLLRNRVLVANSGSYTLTGSSATILRKRALTANGGSYIITGGTAALLRGRVLTTQAGSYNLTGSSAVLLRGRFLVASSGSYTYTGSNATITYTQATIDYPLTALSGTYTLTGSSATILRSKLLVASSGSYLLTGQQASLSVGKHLQALAGAYVISGGSIVIQKTGMVWPLPEQVLLGVQYGPTGFEYTGTLDVLGVKFDITTGQLVKPISNKVVITL